jgi:hypothetical protein
MKRLLIACAIAQTWGIAQANKTGPELAAGTGALSYEFFNLTGYGCTLHYYGGGPNPYAWGQHAQKYGWNGHPRDGGPDDGWGFFNSMNRTQSYTNRVIFYNDTDPVTAPIRVTGSAGGQWVTGAFGQDYSLEAGSSTSAIEYSSRMSGTASAPAIADSWTVQCAPGAKDGQGNPLSQPVVMANMASASDSFYSGTTNTALIRADGTLRNASHGPRTVDPPIANTAVNPAAPGSFGPWSSPSAVSGNVNGMGFVDGSPGTTFNFSAGYTPYCNDSGQCFTPGGLWAAASDPNAGAVFSVVQAMYPVNYANYVTARQWLAESSYSKDGAGTGGYDSTLLTLVYYNPIYGGHFTLALGDPFIISSFNAKILWFLATHPAWHLNNGTFDAGSNTNAGLGLYLALNQHPVFGLDAANRYVNWLASSAAKAAYVINQLNNNAIEDAKKPITHESGWGKFLSIAAQTASVALNQTSSVYGKGWVGGTQGADLIQRTGVNTANGYLNKYVQDKIKNHFTTTTYGTPPATQNAPFVSNPSFSSNNLLGMLLANSQVQTEISGALGLGTTTDFSNPLWSTQSIFKDNKCVASTLSVQNNQYQGTTTCYNSAGSQVSQSSLNPQYVNVYSQNQDINATTNRLNIWDALLTGSDVTTNAQGQLVLANPLANSFEPPTQLYDPDVAAIGTAFNYQTGTETLQSYTPYQYPKLAPALAPFTVAGWAPTSACTNQGFQYKAVETWDAETGILSVSAVQAGCPGHWNHAETIPTVSLWLGACDPNNPAVTFSMATNPLNASLRCLKPQGAVVIRPASALAPISPGWWTSCTYYATGGNLDPATGILTAAGYQSDDYYIDNIFTGNILSCPNPYPWGYQMQLDLTTCQAGSQVQLLMPNYTSASLSCVTPASVSFPAASQPALDYNQCVADPYATGGVVATQINGELGLACTCMPGYLTGFGDGSKLNYGYYATSSSHGTVGTACNPRGG